MYPCGSCGAPACCPGASTWQTTKCLVISCMSSLLKNVLKHSLSAAEEVSSGSVGWEDRGTGTDQIKYAPHSGRTLKVAIWTTAPALGGERFRSEKLMDQTTFIHLHYYPKSIFDLMEELKRRDPIHLYL